MDIVLVVAAADNGVIGRNGQLPWRLKSDLRHFRALTIGRPVLMGRRTFLSIGKPLPGRTNIVVSRDPAFAAAGAIVAPSVPAAFEAARGDALRRSADGIAVAGGAEIFAQTLPFATRVEMTRVHMQADGDTVWPADATAGWQETAREDHPAGDDDEAPFTYLTYRRPAALTAS